MKRLILVGLGAVLALYAADTREEPVGLILCTSKKKQHVELLLAHGPHKIVKWSIDRIKVVKIHTESQFTNGG